MSHPNPSHRRRLHPVAVTRMSRHPPPVEMREARYETPHARAPSSADRGPGTTLPENSIREFKELVHFFLDFFTRNRNFLPQTHQFTQEMSDELGSFLDIDNPTRAYDLWFRGTVMFPLLRYYLRIVMLFQLWNSFELCRRSSDPDSKSCSQVKEIAKKNSRSGLFSKNSPCVSDPKSQPCLEDWNQASENLTERMDRMTQLFKSMIKKQVREHNRLHPQVPKGQLSNKYNKDDVAQQLNSLKESMLRNVQMQNANLVDKMSSLVLGGAGHTNYLRQDHDKMEAMEQEMMGHIQSVHDKVDRLFKDMSALRGRESKQQDRRVEERMREIEENVSDVYKSMESMIGVIQAHQDRFMEKLDAVRSRTQAEIKDLKKRIKQGSDDQLALRTETEVRLADMGDSQEQYTRNQVGHLGTEIKGRLEHMEGRLTQDTRRQLQEQKVEIERNIKSLEQRLAEAVEINEGYNRELRANLKNDRREAELLQREYEKYIFEHEDKVRKTITTMNSQISRYEAKANDLKGKLEQVVRKQGRGVQQRQELEQRIDEQEKLAQNLRADFERRISQQQTDGEARRIEFENRIAEQQNESIRERQELEDRISAGENTVRDLQNNYDEEIRNLKEHVEELHRFADATEDSLKRANSQLIDQSARIEALKTRLRKTEATASDAMRIHAVNLATGFIVFLLAIYIAFINRPVSEEWQYTPPA